MTSPDMHLDTGAMALGALPDDEAAAVEAHLATCDSCPAELAGFLETVALLGSVAAEAPPASLRRAIMARIAVTAQLPPLPESEPTGTSIGKHALPTQPDRGPTGDPTASDAPSNVVPLRRWYRRPAALLAAVIAAVVIGGGAVVAVNQVTNQQQVAQTPEQCVATAADKQELTPTTGAGSLIYAPSCSAVTLDVTGLPALPADQTYQLWALPSQGTPRSLGALPQTSVGQPVTKQTNPGETAVAITAEPASLSTQPTTPIIWQAALAS